MLDDSYSIVFWNAGIIADTEKDGIEKPSKCENSECYQVLFYCKVVECTVWFDALWNRTKAAFHITFIATLKIEKLNFTISLWLLKDMDQSQTREFL